MVPSWWLGTSNPLLSQDYSPILRSHLTETVLCHSHCSSEFKHQYLCPHLLYVKHFNIHLFKYLLNIYYVQNLRRVLRIQKNEEDMVPGLKEFLILRKTTHTNNKSIYRDKHRILWEHKEHQKQPEGVKASGLASWMCGHLSL